MITYLVLAPAMPALAQGFTVQSGQTVGRQVMSNPGDTGTVEAGGAIVSAATDGIGMDAANQTVSVAGSITTTGNVEGIFSGNANAVISISGSITTSGNGAEGVVLGGADARITISGLITTSGSDAEAIVSGGANAVISVSGSITTSGNGAEGILSGGADARISVSGSIITTGTAADGVRANGTGARVTVSGIIIAPQSEAIDLAGANNNVLTLLPGAVLQGGLVLGTGADVLVIGNGLSVNLTFDKVAEILDTRGAPFAISGTRVAVVDPTAIAFAPTLLNDLSNGIFGAIRSRLGGFAGSGASGSGGFAPPSLLAPPMKDETPAGTGYRVRAWAELFGGFRHQDGSQPTVDVRHRVGGLIAGADRWVNDHTRVGVFAGGSKGTVDVEFDSQDVDVDGLYAGVYLRRITGRWTLDLTVTGGILEHDSERRLVNNLVAGGLQHAKATYDGAFVSPELAVSTTLYRGAVSIVPRVSLRYGGLYLDGYTETGAADALTVGSRDVHILQARAELAFPHESRTSDGLLRVALRAGVEGRWHLGDETVNGTLLGQAITFDPGGRDETFGVYAGFSASLTSSNGVTLYARVEGGAEDDSDETLYATGRAGVKIRW